MRADVVDSDVPGGEIAPQPETSFFLFRLGRRTYALAPSVLEQVAAPVEPVPVPMVPPRFRGVCHLRGRLVTVVDLDLVLGLDARSAGDRASTRSDDGAGAPRLLALRIRDLPFAFVADAALGLRAVPNSGVRSVSDDGVVVSRFEDQGEVVSVLDAHALLAAIRGNGDGVAR